MPTYEYKCNKCSKTVMEVRSMNEATRFTSCIDCGGEFAQVYRLTGGPIFKGEGFYSNDKKKPNGE